MKNDKTPTIYIAGPMRGKKDYHQRFFAADKALTEAGWITINPLMLNPDYQEKTNVGIELTKRDYKILIDRITTALYNSDAIYVLEGWARSPGAITERALANWFGLTILFEGVDGYEIPDELKP